MALDDRTATSTLEGARRHARSQSSAAAATELTVPARSARDLPEGIAPDDVVWDETIPGGGYAGRRLPRSTTVRFTDIEGDACLHLVVHSAANPAERINVADTVKVQWQAYLERGAVVLSDMGRALMTVVADTSARHDALCGTSNAALNARRYGDGGIHGPHPNGRDLLALAGAKHGLSRRDLPTGINLFKGVRVGPDGSLHLDASVRPGCSVDLRADMDVLVLVANATHPLDGRADGPVSTVRVTAWRSPSVQPPEQEATTPERQRAYENTEDMLLGGAS